MDPATTSLPELSQLIEQRHGLLRRLVESLESSSLALVQNDAEAIARGAAHQAELCRQWSCFEDQLRRAAHRRSAQPSLGAPGKFPEDGRTARLQSEWEALGTRIRYLTRVHWSLLRHLQRSLAVMNRVVDSCALTYTPDLACSDHGLFRREVRTEVFAEVGLRSGEFPGE